MWARTAVSRTSASLRQGPLRPRPPQPELLLLLTQDPRPEPGPAPLPQARAWGTSPWAGSRRQQTAPWGSAHPGVTGSRKSVRAEPATSYVTGWGSSRDRGSGPRHFRLPSWAGGAGRKPIGHRRSRRTRSTRGRCRHLRSGLASPETRWLAEKLGRRWGASAVGGGGSESPGGGPGSEGWSLNASRAGREAAHNSPVLDHHFLVWVWGLDLSIPSPCGVLN